MNPKEHKETTQARQEENKSKNPYQCDNCGETFTSVSAKHMYESKVHGREAPGRKTKTAGHKLEQE